MKIKNILLAAGLAFSANMAHAGCTEVIGFSQTGQMYNAQDSGLEIPLPAERMQLFSKAGMNLEHWGIDENGDPISGKNAWAEAVLDSVCTEEDPNNPDTIIFYVSSSFGDDIDLWVESIEAAILGIKANRPAATRIFLDSVIGGPGGDLCAASEITPSEDLSCDGDNFNADVRATEQYSPIVTAIRQVVLSHESDSDPEILAGTFSRVQSCEDYCDAKGHIHPDARKDIGRVVGARYRDYLFE